MQYEKQSNYPITDLPEINRRAGCLYEGFKRIGRMQPYPIGITYESLPENIEDLYKEGNDHYRNKFLGYMLALNHYKITGEV